MATGGLYHDDLQADLFGAAMQSAPLARRTDPESSHAAADVLVRSGRHAFQKSQVLAAVKQWPGRTSLELASRMAADRYVIARRLPDLEKDGLVRKGGIRQCSAGKRPAVEWWPTSPDQAHSHERRAADRDQQPGDPNALKRRGAQ